MSGERQEGTSVDLIRKDHVIRYEFVKNYLEGKETLIGLDCFCGNGYGSNILARGLTNSYITSYDASSRAIRSAKEFYRRDNIKFICETYPFDIPESYYDFVVSLESIEHVEMYEDLLANLISSIKDDGLLFISVPNEDKIPHQLNKNPFHVKHFTHQEVTELVDKSGGKILEVYGQDCYNVANKKITSLLPVNDMGLLLKDHEGQFMIFVIGKIPK